MVDAVFLKDSPSARSGREAVRGAVPLRSAPSAAADRLVATHQYLCVRGARKFLRAGLERGDLEQVAAIGLIKASRRYDPAASTPFEAYAWQMVVGELMHYVRDSEGFIRLPRALRALERRYLRAHDTLLGRYSREPSDAELASEIGILVVTVYELRRARQCASPLALDDRDVDARSLGGAKDAENRLLVQSAFATLETLERRIIAGVYLLGLTQLELARRLGISAKRVSRTHRSALLRMQRATA